MRVSHSIQAEGIFGVMKEDRSCDRFKRCGLEGTHLEFGLAAMGFNLCKYRNKMPRAKDAE